jgi:hypothetical protein
MDLDEIHGLSKLREGSKNIVDGMYKYIHEKIDIELLQPQFATYCLETTHETGILK